MIEFMGDYLVKVNVLGHLEEDTTTTTSFLDFLDRNIEKTRY
jgi:hypothetical protein